MSTRKIMAIGVTIFCLWIGGVIYLVGMIANHSHEIASDAGSLAHDFMKAAKGEKTTDQ